MVVSNTGRVLVNGECQYGFVSSSDSVLFQLLEQSSVCRLVSCQLFQRCQA